MNPIPMRPPSPEGKASANRRFIPPPHPWFGELAVTARRRARHAARITLVLVAAAGALSGLAYALGLLPVAAGKRWLMPLALWPWQALLMVAIGTHALVRFRLQSVRLQLQTGWWAAVPIDPRSRAVALWLVAAMVATCWMALSAIAVGVLAVLGDVGDSGNALLVVPAGVSVGTVTAAAVAFRPRPGRRAAAIGARRRPLFSTAWLDDARLPHLSDWQRRDVLQRWRTGASALPALAALLLLPSGASPLVLLGMLTFAWSAGWLAVVLRASIATATGCAELLHATPVSGRSQLAAAARYPAFASVCAVTVGALAPLAVRSWWLMAAWLLLVALLTAPALPSACRLIPWRLIRFRTKRR